VKSLRFLQEKYKFGNNYIIVGHSCGATLACQAVVKDVVYSINSKIWEGVKLLKGLIGLEGIYDIPALVKAHKDIPIYQECIERAFGLDKEISCLVSPTAGQFQKTWTECVLAIIAHSDEDDLVEKNQADLMKKVLEQWAGEDGIGGRKGVLLVDQEIKGKHDDIWKGGEGAFACIEKALTILVENEKIVA
jgi:kynurenine formamidase